MRGAAGVTQRAGHTSEFTYEFVDLCGLDELAAQQTRRTRLFILKKPRPRTVGKSLCAFLWEFCKPKSSRQYPQTCKTLPT
jgi:hypothetical protein